MNRTLEITFLGTGTSQGVPVIACQCPVCTSGNPKDKRLRTSILLSDGETTATIDAGPDFRQQLLRANVCDLQGVVFTHQHKDHIAGLDDVRAFNFKYNRPFDVFATNAVQDALRTEFSYVFTDHSYPGIPQLRLNTIEAGKPFEVGSLFFNPFTVMHLRMPVLGFRIGGLVYITDANRIDEAVRANIRDAEVLVLNALQHAPHVSHFTLEEAIDVAADLRARTTYFVHMGHRMGLHAEVEANLPTSMHLAYDGLKLHVHA